MLSILYRKLFYNISIEITSTRIFKILYHPYLDSCIIEYKEFTICEVENIEQLLQDDSIELTSFLKFPNIDKNKKASIFPKNKLRHNQEYAEIIFKKNKNNFLKECNGSSEHFCCYIDRTIIFKFNKILRIGIAQYIITSKISDNYYILNEEKQEYLRQNSKKRANGRNVNMKFNYTERPNDQIEIIKYVQRFKAFYK